MELHDAIRTRRSVRVFQSTPVARPLIEGIIADATYAPSRWNLQPWRFHVATGAALARVADVVALTTVHLEEYLKARHPEAIETAVRFHANLGGAPVAIAVSAPIVEGRLDVQSEALAIGSAVQNLLLSAVDHGLAACCIAAPEWIRGSFADVFGVPEGSEIIVLIAVGIAAEEPPCEPRAADAVTFLA